MPLCMLGTRVTSRERMFVLAANSGGICRRKYRERLGFATLRVDMTWACGMVPVGSGRTLILDWGHVDRMPTGAIIPTAGGQRVVARPASPAGPATRIVGSTGPDCGLVGEGLDRLG